jgi:molybdate transport system ATP-binding protein
MSLSLDLSLSFGAFRLAVKTDLPLSGITAIFGHSGSGKSTLLRVIAGLETGATGRVALGADHWQGNGAFTPPHRRGVGYVFQDTRLFNHLSVAGNLAYADKRAQSLPGPAWEEVVSALDLAPLLTRRPHSLSGGEASRVAMGRALLTRPRLLLMDEPLSALDEARKAEILPYLERLRDRMGIPILYVSHSTAEVARLADHLVILEAGAIRFQGPVATLLADPAAARSFGLREAGALLNARIARHEEDGLTCLETSAGPLLLPHVAAPLGTRLRVRILAQDVLLSVIRPQGLSALNILPATVQSLRMGEGPGAFVQLRAGDELLLARITRRSAAALALEPGSPCFAILKSVSVAPFNIGANIEANIGAAISDPSPPKRK